MITEAILVAFLEMSGWLLGLFPEDEIDWPDASWIPSFVGSHIGPFDHILPLSEFSAVTVILVSTVFPILLILRVSIFVWFLLPFVK